MDRYLRLDVGRRAVSLFRSLLTATAICLLSSKAFTDGEVTVKIVSPTESQIIWNRTQSIKFNCSVISGGVGVGTFMWWRNNIHPFKTAGNITNTPYWSSFVKDGLQIHDDAGVNYKCTYGNSSDDVTASDDVTLHISSKPQIVVAQEKTTRSLFNAFVDDSPKIRCFAEGWPQPTLVWFRNNINVNSSNWDNKYTLRKAGRALELKIIGIQLEDDGHYICMAKNALGAVNHTVLVHVEERPPVREPVMEAAYKTYTAEIGDNASLICHGEEIKESSFTIVSWEYNQTQISSDDHYDIVDVYSNQSMAKISPKLHTELTIYNFSLSDQGLYICSVTTVTGNASDFIWLTVKSKDDGKKGGIGIGALIAIVVSCVLVIGLGVAMFLLWRRIKRKRLRTEIAEKYDHDDERFDKEVFVSYSSKDYDWVEQNLQPLFERENIQYIIHSRDFVPGKAFLDNMAESVYHSRKVIVVISANYLRSGYCKDEMNMAVHRCVEKQDSSLILIRIDDIKAKELPKSVRCRTFIDYTSSEEKDTWEARVVEYVRVSGVSQHETSQDSTQESDEKFFLGKFFKKRRKTDEDKLKELASV